MMYAASSSSSLLLLRSSVPSATSARSLTTCYNRLDFRRLEVTEKDGGKEIVVRGVAEESTRKRFLVDVGERPGACGGKDCHPLCKWEHVDDIKHTDVLILEQFVEGDGRLMSRSVTGLCKRQQFRITKFVKMAQKAGLMPGKDLYAAEKKAPSKYIRNGDLHPDRIEKPWAAYNSYYDEKTADAQWRERERNNRIKHFEK